MGIINDKVYSVGEKVKVFDCRFYKDDISTPICKTMRPAKILDIYKDPKEDRLLYDVAFDDRISKGHLVHALEKILEK